MSNLPSDPQASCRSAQPKHFPGHLSHGGALRWKHHETRIADELHNHPPCSVHSGAHDFIISVEHLGNHLVSLGPERLCEPRHVSECNDKPFFTQLVVVEESRCLVVLAQKASPSPSTLRFSSAKMVHCYDDCCDASIARVAVGVWPNCARSVPS